MNTRTRNQTWKKKLSVVVQIEHSGQQHTWGKRVSIKLVLRSIWSWCQQHNQSILKTRGFMPRPAIKLSVPQVSPSTPLNIPQHMLLFLWDLCLCFTRSPLCQACSWAPLLPRMLLCQQEPWKASHTTHLPCQQLFANLPHTRHVQKCHTGHGNSWPVWELSILKSFVCSL